MVIFYYPAPALETRSSAGGKLSCDVRLASTVQRAVNGWKADTWAAPIPLYIGDSPHFIVAGSPSFERISTLAGHASPKGFAMLRPSASSLARIGPFFDHRALKGVLEEMSKHVVPAAMHFLRHFDERNRSDYLTAIHFMEISGKWAERFLGAPYDAAKIDEIRLHALQLSAAFSKPPKNETT